MIDINIYIYNLSHIFLPIDIDLFMKCKQNLGGLQKKA